MTEEEQADAKKKLKRWRDELAMEDIIRRIPRTPAGPEKEALMVRHDMLERCRALYAMRDELEGLEADNADAEQIEGFRKQLENEEMQVEIMELEHSIPEIVDEEEKATAEARLAEVQEALRAAQEAADAE